MKSEIVLHIGAHKTGSTTIQHMLFANRDRLATQGIFYPTVGRLPKAGGAFDFADPNHPERGFALIKHTDLLVPIKASGADRVIVSGEEMSMIFDPARMRELKDLLCPHFRRIRVVSYLHRQDKHVVSHSRQGAKRRFKAETWLYGNTTKALPTSLEPAIPYLDYNRRIGHWLDTFGDENVTVRVFERARLVGGDAWQDFVETVGFEATGFERVTDRNPSLGLTATKIGHLLNEKPFSHEARRRIVRAMPDDAPQKPARGDAEALYTRFRAGNIALNARLGAEDGSDLFDADFSSYPEAPHEAWNDESAERAISALIDRLSTIAQTPDCDTLMSVAEYLKREGQRGLARRLSRVALAHSQNNHELAQRFAALHRSRLKSLIPRVVRRLRRPAR